MLFAAPRWSSHVLAVINQVKGVTDQVLRDRGGRALLLGGLEESTGVRCHPRDVHKNIASDKWSKLEVLPQNIPRKAA